MSLFDNTKKFAKRRGLNLQQVAEKSGLSKNAIYKWNQADKHPSESSIKAVAYTLGVSYEELIGKSAKANHENIDLKASIDDDDVIMTYEGRPIPPEDLEYIKRILDGGK